MYGRLKTTVLSTYVAGIEIFLDFLGKKNFFFSFSFGLELKQLTFIFILLGYVLVGRVYQIYVLCYINRNNNIFLLIVDCCCWWGGLWYGYVWMGKRANDTFTYLYRHYPCEAARLPHVCMYVCMVYVGTHKAGIIAMMTDD